MARLNRKWRLLLEDLADLFSVLTLRRLLRPLLPIRVQVSLLAPRLSSINIDLFLRGVSICNKTPSSSSSVRFSLDNRPISPNRSITTVRRNTEALKNYRANSRSGLVCVRLQRIPICDDELAGESAVSKEIWSSLRDFSGDLRSSFGVTPPVAMKLYSDEEFGDLDGGFEFKYSPGDRNAKSEERIII
ncbi:hypothetical protein F3Y22_tig00109987pilonHSYRG00298 [Hibiscus syriacus]|uniref:Uncharacterized protein n=1 Tax=Hibiscus syriacus TaxID=106335 RepID=A0A6A3BSL6_HIBSY|nr:hypothetical protein F3Y22_tig00109987pilonHSYRG00298 [Hibiscus syriacus]